MNFNFISYNVVFVSLKPPTSVFSPYTHTYIYIYIYIYIYKSNFDFIVCIELSWTGR